MDLPESLSSKSRGSPGLALGSGTLEKYRNTKGNSFRVSRACFRPFQKKSTFGWAHCPASVQNHTSGFGWYPHSTVRMPKYWARDCDSLKFLLYNLEALYRH